jgi:hypothetical protein
VCYYMYKGKLEELEITLDKVLFYSANALLMAVSKFGKSATYFEVRGDTLPTTRLRSRSTPGLNAEILRIAGAEHYVHDLANINEFLLDPDLNRWLIEMSLFTVLPEGKLERNRDNIQGMFFGADVYLAKFTLNTLFSGKRAWKDCLKWRKSLKGLPTSSLLLYESRNRINRLVSLPIEKVTRLQLESLVLMLSACEFEQEISFFAMLENHFIVFGIDEREHHLEDNVTMIREALKFLGISNCDVLIKPHPNFSGDLDIIVGRIRETLSTIQLGRIQLVDKRIPLELLIYSAKCLHFFGAPSSALMAYPRERFTLLRVMPSRCEFTYRSYLNAAI